MAPYVAIAETAKSSFVVAAIELFGWKNGDNVLDEARAFAQITSAVVRRACRDLQLNLILRCAVRFGEVKFLVIFSGMVADIKAESDVRALVGECLERYKIWNARSLGKEEVDEILVVEAPTEVVRLVKPLSEFEICGEKLLPLLSTCGESGACDVLLPQVPLIVDFGMFPVVKEDVTAELRRTSAISVVLARRGLAASSALEKNSIAADLILGEKLFVGSAVTLSGVAISSSASGLSLYKNDFRISMYGRVLWVARPGDMPEGQLGFVSLDYAAEQGILGLLEPDARSVSHLAWTVSRSLSAFQRQLEPLRPKRRSADSPFDVFLSHNSKDIAAVRRLASALTSEGVRVWFSENNLIPGRRWQEALEEVIQQVKSAAVLVGPSGLGPWEVQEMGACLMECVSRGLPVIPVLLPGAPVKPELPLFLKQFTWVDLRHGLGRDSINKLVWGITGVNPNE